MFCQIYWRWRLNSSAFCSYVNWTWAKPLPSNIFLVKRVFHRQPKVVNSLSSPKKGQYHVKSKKGSPVKIERIMIIDWLIIMIIEFSVYDYVHVTYDNDCHLQHVYFPCSYKWILELSWLKITANWLVSCRQLGCLRCERKYSHYHVHIVVLTFEVQLL